MLMMHDLYREAGDDIYDEISFLQQEASEEKEAKNFDKQYYSTRLDRLINAIVQHQDHVCKYCEKFKCEVGYWSSHYLDESLKTLEKARALLNGDLTPDILEKFDDQMYYAENVWFTKYLEDFECWRDGLAAKGLHLSNQVTIFDADNSQQAFLKMMANALQAEKMYFAISRTNKQSTRNLKDQFLSNRRTRGKTVPIRAQTTSGRGLITASTAAVAESIAEVDQTRLKDRNSIAQLTGWHKKSTMNWNREKVIRGYLEYKAAPREFGINYQFQPVPGQLANIKVNGIEQYGEKPRDILAVINKLTQKDPEKEKLLAQALLQYKHGDGNALGETNLTNLGMDLRGSSTERRKLISQFNRAAYLICFHEVTRRKNQGYKPNAHGQMQPVTELPFGIAVACVLKLISDGHLRMADVFNQDTLYGVFTGTSIMSDNYHDTLLKFNALFALFVEKYAPQMYEVAIYSDQNDDELNIVFSPQFFHEVLRTTDGGESDSDNEEYDLPDEQDENVEQLERDVAHLELRSFTLRL